MTRPKSSFSRLKFVTGCAFSALYRSNIAISLVRPNENVLSTRTLTSATLSERWRYVEFGHCAFGHLNGCLLPYVVPTTGGRYLRILVTPDPTRVDHDRLIALIACRGCCSAA